MDLPVLERDLDLDLLLVRLLVDLLLVRLLVERDLLLLLGCLSEEELELPEEERGLVDLPTGTSNTAGSGVFTLVFKNSLNKSRISLSCKNDVNCSSSPKQICTVYTDCS
jgi:hypothetical protein